MVNTDQKVGYGLGALEMKYVRLTEITPKKLSVKQARARLRRSRYSPKNGRWIFSEKAAPKVKELLSR